MTMQTQGSQSGLGKDPKHVTTLDDFSKHFKKAVEDAQYLLMYASSNCPNDINRSTLKILITTRLKVEKGEKLTATDETDFWLAYQDLWKLVQPVTAESIKANLAIEGSAKNFLPKDILARWFGGDKSSKARKSVNRYIVFTGIVLILLLILQIYWVIGNQLVTRADELSKNEAEITQSLADNQQEYSQMEIRYKRNEQELESFTGFYEFYTTPEWERDVLDINAKRTGLEKKLELLKSQLERNSNILEIWSKPWSWLITNNLEPTNEDEPINEEYASQYEYIDGQIEAVRNQIKGDPTGSLEAENQIIYLTSSASSIQFQLNELNSQYSALDSDARLIQGKLNTINQKTALESTRKTLVERQSEIQTNIDALRGQLAGLPEAADPVVRSDLEKQISDLAADLANVQGELTEVNNQLAAFSNNANITESTSQLEGELDRVIGERASVLDQIQYYEDQLQYYVVDPQQLAEQITADRNASLTAWETERVKVERREAADAEREKTRREQFQNQLAGQFVLVVLQSYLLPLLYGILGAGTSVLRTLSKQIEDVTFSESAGVQHLLRISLGALAGIMVGWFSFLLPDEANTFLGSVSPLAIAFLVGYNIELFFSLMEVALNRVNEARQRSQQQSGSQIIRTQATKPQSSISETDVLPEKTNHQDTNEADTREKPPTPEEPG